MLLQDLSSVLIKYASLLPLNDQKYCNNQICILPSYVNRKWDSCVCHCSYMHTSTVFHGLLLFNTYVEPLCINLEGEISIYILVELFLSACKLLLQHACDRRETWDFYRVPHGECHKGVDGRRVATVSLLDGK